MQTMIQTLAIVSTLGFGAFAFLSIADWIRGDRARRDAAASPSRVAMALRESRDADAGRVPDLSRYIAPN